MKTRAAVAFEKAKPLQIVEVDLEGPRAGEVLVEIKATGVCHTDDFTISGADPEGLFPAIMGHEGAGIVVDVGAGRHDGEKGRSRHSAVHAGVPHLPVVPVRKTNLCTAIRGTQGAGVMPDGTSRFSFEGKKVHHYMGCSTFSNFTVLPEIAVAKVRADAPFDKICYIGCGVTTGIGAVLNTAKATPGCTCDRVRPRRHRPQRHPGPAARRCRHDHRRRSQSRARSLGQEIWHDALRRCQGGRQGPAATSDRHDQARCRHRSAAPTTRSTAPAMSTSCAWRSKISHRGWGESIIIGVAGSGQEIRTRPFQLVTGRVWKGTAFGGARGRTDVPKIVDWYMDGKIQIDAMITHMMPLPDINRAFDLMHKGESIRGVITF